jgi:hypothetical protein
MVKDLDEPNEQQLFDIRLELGLDELKTFFLKERT